MSAYIVSKSHIDALVRAATDLNRSFSGEKYTVGYARPRFDANGNEGPTEQDLLGRMLWEENVKSVSYRYPNETELPGPSEGVDPSAYVFDHRTAKILTPVEVLKAISGYEYQSCEHEGWAESQAKRFCDDLQSMAIRKLPGYDAADWEVPPAPAGQPISLLEMSKAARKK